VDMGDLLENVTPFPDAATENPAVTQHRNRAG
jgi:hypothetical protein